MTTTFFLPCQHHPHHLKNEAHYYCIACSPGTPGMCIHCLNDHNVRCKHAPWFQTYRYMYNDIVRAADVAGLIGLDGIQHYNANGHLAVHLRQREAPARSPPNFTRSCAWCERKQDSKWKWCCLECKLSDIGMMERGPRTPTYPVSNKGERFFRVISASNSESHTRGTASPPPSSSSSCGHRRKKLCPRRSPES